METVACGCTHAASCKAGRVHSSRWYGSMTRMFRTKISGICQGSDQDSQAGPCGEMALRHAENVVRYVYDKPDYRVLYAVSNMKKHRLKKHGS